MTAPVRLVVRDGRFLTMAPGRPDPFNGWMSVGHDGRIAGIGAGEPSGEAITGADTIIDAHGSFVAPGFVSAHSHLFTSGTRGLGLDQALYGWIEAMTMWHRHLDAEDLYWMTFHGAIDFLNNGITTAYDFTSGRLEFSAEDAGRGSFQGVLRPPEHGEAQIRAKVDAGIRFVNSVMLDDTVGTRADAIDRIDEIVGYSRRFEHHPCFLKMAVSGAVQWAPDRSTAELETEVMQRHGLINQSHFLETPYAIDLQRSKFEWYRDAGALGPDLLFGHFVQATDDQIDDAAAHQCGMVWQPTSNGRLASGIANIPRIREVGMRMGVGLDDQSCTDVSDPFMNMRMGIYLLRAVHKDPAAMPVRDMLELHTLESARVLGVDDDVGSLEVGKYADFVVVDPRAPDTGPVWDDFGTYVLASSLRNLKQVWRGGELVSQDGVVVHVDADEVSREVHERYARIRHNELAGT